MLFPCGVYIMHYIPHNARQNCSMGNSPRCLTFSAESHIIRHLLCALCEIAVFFVVKFTTKNTKGKSQFIGQTAQRQELKQENGAEGTTLRLRGTITKNTQRLVEDVLWIDYCTAPWSGESNKERPVHIVPQGANTTIGKCRNHYAGMIRRRTSRPTSPSEYDSP